VGVSCHQGIRNKNEDDFIIIPNINSLQGKNDENQAQEAFFGLFDGHCGKLAAIHAREHLYKYAVTHKDFQQNIELALREACQKIDEDFLEMSQRDGLYDGTTAIFAVIRGESLIVGNIGDCAAVLCRANRAIALSTAHKPASPEEQQRIQLANGWVTFDEDGISRVCGELSVSRAIGDIDYKRLVGKDVSQCFFDFPADHNKQFYNDLITAEPDFVAVDIQEDDEFLLIACDGLWDVMDEETAVEVVSEFFLEDDCVESVASKMCHLAEKMGSPDNITVILVRLHRQNTDQPSDNP